MLTRLAKYSTALFLALAAVFIFNQTALAKDFQADYDISYTLNPDTKLVRVKQQISLTNKKPNLRASSYSLTLEKGSYRNLSATDSRGRMNFTEKESNGHQSITFTFNDRVVGVNNTLRWTIEYDANNVATKNGQMWDISIPRVKAHDSYDIASYTASLITPASLGEVHYVTPQPARSDLNSQTNTYIFNKDQIMPAGILASYGPAQVFEFELIYHLKNPQIGQVKTEIALPPDIQGYQQIIHGQLHPKPASLRTDQDGNTLATYYLGPQATLDITFKGHARIDQAKANLQSPAMISDIPEELVRNYTIEQKYWETSNQQLKDKVAEITDPQKSAVDNARAIYQYVTKTLTYNTARINENLARMGAVAAYNDPDNAVCMEFTDLFITMARIAGIPAREIDGYAYTTGEDAQPIYYPELGSDILHAWAQIYLPDVGWVMVDPTWGSTTDGVDFFGHIDLNRIAFAIKGISSERPYAAGAYKTNASQDGDVKVTFSNQDVKGKAELKSSIYSVSGLQALTQRPYIELINTGSTTLFGVELGLRKDDPDNLLQLSQTHLGRLLPGQSIEVPLEFSKNLWLNAQQVDLSVTATGHDFYQQQATSEDRQTVEVPAIVFTIFLPIIGIVLLIAALTAALWYALHQLHAGQKWKFWKKDTDQALDSGGNIKDPQSTDQSNS